MENHALAQLIPILQTAIGPAILISGVGLLLLTMTNRFGRITDRVRSLAADVPDSPLHRGSNRLRQLDILWRRARIVRLAITAAAVSALCSSLLIAAIFLTALWRIDYAWLVGVLFAGSMLFLIFSLALFIRDINQSLLALRLELEQARKSAS
ncbi:MAG: DUF2721 domain-containing protein [Elusimicrobia bacterium]|nr:DUF2721 domain-containing protein [Elusimicrobiota bacterium]